MKNKSIYSKEGWFPPRVMNWLNPNSKLERPVIVDATPPKNSYVQEIDIKSIEPCGTTKVGCHLDSFNSTLGKV